MKPHHKTLAREGRPDYVFAFHDFEEIGPKMLARVAKHTILSRKTFSADERGPTSA